MEDDKSKQEKSPKTRLSRRDFLKTAALAGTMVATGQSLVSAQEGDSSKPETKEKSERETTDFDKVADLLINGENNIENRKTIASEVVSALPDFVNQRSAGYFSVREGSNSPTEKEITFFGVVADKSDVVPPFSKSEKSPASGPWGEFEFQDEPGDKYNVIVRNVNNPFTEAVLNAATKGNSSVNGENMSCFLTGRQLSEVISGFSRGELNQYLVEDIGFGEIGMFAASINTVGNRLDEEQRTAFDRGMAEILDKGKLGLAEDEKFDKGRVLGSSIPLAASSKVNITMAPDGILYHNVLRLEAQAFTQTYTFIETDRDQSDVKRNWVYVRDAATYSKQEEDIDPFISNKGNQEVKQTGKMIPEVDHSENMAQLREMALKFSLDNCARPSGPDVGFA